MVRWARRGLLGPVLPRAGPWEPWLAWCQSPPCPPGAQLAAGILISLQIRSSFRLGSEALPSSREVESREGSTVLWSLRVSRVQEDAWSSTPLPCLQESWWQGHEGPSPVASLSSQPVGGGCLGSRAWSPAPERWSRGTEGRGPWNAEP